MTHHGDESQHLHDHQGDVEHGDAPVGGTLGTTGTEGYGMPEQVVGDELHTDERAQTAEESVTRGTIGGQVPGGLGTGGLGEDQLGGGLSPDSGLGAGRGADENLPPEQGRGGFGGSGPGADVGGLGSESAGVPNDQVSEGGVSADPLDGQNATGGYGDESTGFSDEGSTDEPPQGGQGDGERGTEFPDSESLVDRDLVDRDPGEDATTVNGGNADR